MALRLWTDVLERLARDSLREPDELAWTIECAPSGVPTWDAVGYRTSTTLCDTGSFVDGAWA
eukprot:11323223-Prorocentrum_lima.AAC.1